MENTTSISDSISQFNERCQAVTDKVNKTFKLSVKFQPVNVTQPKYYNSFYNKYVRESKAQAINSLSDLTSQLEKYNLIAPVFLTDWVDWSDIDKILTKIEQRINKY